MQRILPVILISLILSIWISCSTKENTLGVSEIAEPKKKSGIAIAKIEEGIKRYIDEVTHESGGYFYINTDTHDLSLKLVRVHTEYLSNLGPKKYFACVDLADISGDVYDVDFFMEGEPDSMFVVQTIVHKLNGKPFYSWKQNPDKTWQQIPIENSGNELLGVREGEDHFDFIYKGQLPEIKKAARLWLPLAQSDAFQTIEILKENLPGIKSLLHEKEFGNSVILLELSPAESKQDFEIIYRVRRKEKGPYTDNNTNPAQYLDANILMPVGGRFREIVDETITDKNNSTALMRARALYDYIIDNMRYMKYGDYGRGDALYACDSKTGNCTEFHSLFISLARTAGIPARFAIGAAIPSDRDEGGIDGYHCWAEFFAEGQWWPVDISEGNKYTALATYYFGRHPANRIELSRGRDLRITPGPIAGPINFLAYPILELDGKPEAVKTSFSFQRLQ